MLTKRVSSAVLLCALGAGSLSLAKPLSLDEVRAALAANRGAHWTAGTSHVTQLSPADRHALLGAPAPTGDVFVTRQAARADLPATYTWGNVGGSNFLSPIIDQGRCGSCVAFATIGTLETQMNIARHTTLSPYQFSAQHLFSCGGGTCTMGWTPDEAVSYLKASGVPDDACFPYSSGALGQDAQCSATCADSAARSFKIAGSTQPTTWTQDVNAVKQALLKGPLITTLTVYEDFYYYQSGVYKHTTGDFAGGHAVSIIGWNDDEKAWIVRNSWGPDWGSEGFFHIAWDDQDSGLGDSTWAMQIADASDVQLSGVPERVIWRGQASFGVRSTYTGTVQTAWNLTRNGALVANGSAVNGQASFDTTSLADGVYTLVGSAQAGGQTYNSQPHTVAIANGPVSGTLAFTNIKDGDSLNAAKQLEFDVTAQPVPFQRVVFHTRNVATGVTAQRGTTNVASHMAINWRVEPLPKGTYELTLEGSDGKLGSVTSNAIHVTVK